MKSFLFLAASLFVVGCQTPAGEFYSANKQHDGVAQFATHSAYAGPETTPGSLPSANKESNGVAQFAKKPAAAADVAVTEEAPKAEAAAPVAAAPKADCPAVSAKSTKAVGQPCLTTEDFIASLKLSKAEQKKALAALKKARAAAAH